MVTGTASGHRTQRRAVLTYHHFVRVLGDHLGRSDYPRLKPFLPRWKSTRYYVGRSHVDRQPNPRHALCTAHGRRTAAQCNAREAARWAHPCPHLHQDWGSARPHLHQDWGSARPHLRRDWGRFAHATGPSAAKCACPTQVGPRPERGRRGGGACKFGCSGSSLMRCCLTQWHWHWHWLQTKGQQ